MWIEIKELLGVAGLPKTVPGMTKKAKLENWDRRRKAGIKGNVYEYHISSLPPETQQALKLNETRKLIAEGKFDSQPTQQSDPALWSDYNQATGAKKAQAEIKFRSVVALEEALLLQIPMTFALEQTAKQFNVSAGSLKNWYYKVKTHPRTDWLAILLNRSGKGKVTEQAEFTPKAWEFFKGEYLTTAQKSFDTCYYLLTLAAKENSWVIPSKRTVKRRLEKEVNKLSQILLREGEYALQSLYPHQIRTVEHLHALEIVNGDGYQHNVWVQWDDNPEAKPIRPKTWYWQDVRTRKILAYVVDDSENADQLRMSLMQLIMKYGLPKQLTLDNTLAASNKQMSGYSHNRKRFKQKQGSDIDPATGKPREIKGVFEMLGLKIVRTDIISGKGNGQAKPIERAFQHLEQLIDKQKIFNGFYTGSGNQNKPEDYQYKVGIDKETFLKQVEEGIRQFNAYPNRQNEICMGKMSCDEAWERDYPKATIVKPTLEQLEVLMMVGESTKLAKNGTFYLKAGGKKFANGYNRYWAEPLVARHQEYPYLTVRFNPYDLHGEVYVYDSQDRFLCTAECIEDVAFDNMEAARQHKRAKGQFVKAVKAETKAIERMNAIEALAALPEMPEEKAIEANYTEFTGLNLNTILNQEQEQPLAETQEWEEKKAKFSKGWQKFKQEAA